MTQNKYLVDVFQLVHGWATVGIGDSSKVMIHKELIDALKRRADINDDVHEPYDYWLIDGIAVREPNINGKILGSINTVEIKGKSVLRMSNKSFEHLMKASKRNSDL